MTDHDNLQHCTVIALDLAFSALVHNLHYHQPALAGSIADDLTQAASGVPTHLPPEMNETAEILNKWASILRNGAMRPDAHRSN